MLSEWLPVAAEQPVLTDATVEWGLSPDGRLCRLTRGWDGRVAAGGAAEPAPAALRESSVGWLHSRRDGQWIAAWRLLNGSKVVYVAHPALWSRLNGAHLEAHIRFWAELVAWSLRTDLQGGGSGPRLVPESVRATAGHGVEVLATGEAAGPLALREEGGGAVRHAEAQPFLPGTVRYVTPALEAGLWSLEAGPARARLCVQEEFPEYGRLSLDLENLRALAAGTQGELMDVTDAPALLNALHGKQTTERVRYVFHAWRHWLTVVLLALLVSAEWVWRKWVGKI
jgi:hypothetical protein